MQITVIRRIHYSHVKLHSHLFKYLRKLQFVRPFIYKDNNVVVTHARFGIPTEQFGAFGIVRYVNYAIADGHQQRGLEIANHQNFLFRNRTYAAVDLLKRLKEHWFRHPIFFHFGSLRLVSII